MFKNEEDIYTKNNDNVRKKMKITFQPEIKIEFNKSKHEIEDYIENCNTEKQITQQRQRLPQQPPKTKLYLISKSFGI